MTPEQIKTWTVTQPNGTIYPASGTEWYVESGKAKLGPFSSRTEALAEYELKFGEEGSSCLNCGS